MFNLIVLSSFVSDADLFHETGTMITDKEEVENILKSGHSEFVMRIAALPAEKHDENNNDPDAVR